MQRQGDISRITGRPVIHRDTSTLSPAKYLPLLKLIRDATFISRLQLELLIAGQTKETNYDCRNRRLSHLVELGLIQVYPECFSYPGRVFGITPRGMKILELAGLGKFRGSAYREAQANVGQMPRFLKLNEIEIAAREAFNVLRCVRARELRSLNRASRHPTRKAYDSIAVIAGAPNSSAQIYLGIQYERTIKSKARYAQIRKNLEAESQIHGLLYFVDSEKAAAFISREVYSATVPVGVVIASQFQSDGADATLRVLDGLSVVRAMAGLIAHPLCDLLSEFDQTNAPIADS